MKIYNLIHEQDTDAAWGCDVRSFTDKLSAQNAMRESWESTVKAWEYDAKEHKDEDEYECCESTAVIRDDSDVESWRIEVLDRIGVTELRRTLAYSPEEIEAMYQRNENFNGKRADFDKLRLFQEIKTELTEFLQCCGDVRKLEEIKPNQYEKNAILFLDVSIVAAFSKDEVAMLTAIMNKADRVVVSTVGGSCTRFSFCVENIWTD